MLIKFQILEKDIFECLIREISILCKIPTLQMPLLIYII